MLVVCALFSGRVEGFSDDIYKEFLFVVGFVPHNSYSSLFFTILNNISSLLPFVLKMSQAQVGSLVLTIVVDDLMSILYRTTYVSINPLMVWWEKSQSCLCLVSR